MTVLEDIELLIIGYWMSNIWKKFLVVMEKTLLLISKRRP